MTALMRKRPSEAWAARPAPELSDAEKARLFDAAMAAGAEGSAAPSVRMLMAFADAYVAIRDREDGII